MKKALVLTAIAVVIQFTSASSKAGAQTPKRIQFAKGRSTAVVRGTTVKFGAAFVLRAKSGQKLVLDLSPASGVGIKVETIGRFGEMVLLREEAGGKCDVGLEETGDYTIFIGPLGSKPITFTLKVEIKKLSDI